LTYDGVTFVSDTSYCVSVSLLSCFIPMSRLTEFSAPFKLPLNTFVQARVRAVNALGSSVWSEPNTNRNYPDVAFAKTVPDTPSKAPYRDPDSGSWTTSAISVVMPEIQDNSNAAGGTEITSYQLEWKQPGDVSFQDLVGGSGGNLNRFITVNTTPGA